MDMLEWLHSQNCQVNEIGFVDAAKKNNLVILEWAEQKGYNLSCVCKIAAKSGNLEILVWLDNHNILDTPNATYGAASGGHLHILNWNQKMLTDLI